MRIKKGDNVKVIAGKDKGKSGAVLKFLPDTNRVLVEGVNVFTKRMRPKRQNQKGEIVQLPRSFNASNVMIICPNCKKPARIGVRMEGNAKVRFCRKCEAVM